jgi:structural maintenance of chromosome 4
LQGEVESIALMKPKAMTEHEDGLLEYLEDIIGTSGYKAPIDEALKTMDDLSEDRQSKLARLRITERERDTLEERKRAAEEHLRTKNDLVRAQSRLWQYYVWKCLVNEEQYNKRIVRVHALPHAQGH